jgi:hypothetical protein
MNAFEEWISKVVERERERKKERAMLSANINMGFCPLFSILKKYRMF